MSRRSVPTTSLQSARLGLCLRCHDWTRRNVTKANRGGCENCECIFPPSAQHGGLQVPLSRLEAVNRRRMMAGSRHAGIRHSPSNLSWMDGWKWACCVPKDEMGQ
ncbi:hypothetical protein B0T14DRAFT_232916 [Immersiella caudata]|uniref:Uncharacterized protein n=1 Tax=Immersiella caudata TaxID=314043 RepID=A0AA39WRX9_9PEZI|nr:hypothetical protein B0T14DRAFT_232916 [Immersiella caudata]